jgi:hypothetical protein
MESGRQRRIKIARARAWRLRLIAAARIAGGFHSIDAMARQIPTRQLSRKDWRTERRQIRRRTGTV